MYFYRYMSILQRKISGKIAVGQWVTITEESGKMNDQRNTQLTVLLFFFLQHENIYIKFI